MPGNLLIVDDEPQIGSALTRLLRADGYSISRALNPIEGIKLMNEQPFDVVLSDYMMPGVNGVEFLSEVSQSFPDTVRLMLSGQAEMAAVKEAVDSGAIFKFITKPWNNDALRTTIREAFEQSSEKAKPLDDESGWLTRTKFLEQQVAKTDDWMLVVGEWVNAATCLSDYDSEHRLAVHTELADRIKKKLRISGEIGLVEPGTFACICENDTTEEEWNQLYSVLDLPIAAGDSSFQGDFRIGLSPIQSEDLNVPLRQALIAVTDASSGAHQSYTKELGGQVHQRRTLESDLRRAIEREELYVELQPQLETSRKTVISAETLLRWRHPRLGLVSPLDVVDMAEQSALINDIGFWIAKECCELLKHWSADTTRQICRLSLNVSPRQFLTGTAARDLDKLIDSYKLSAADLQIEVPESCIVNEPEECATRLCELAETGVRIALDDFGTARATLADLKDLPLDTLKIDRSLISDLENTDGQSIRRLEQTVRQAKELDLELVAQGIETHEQARICTDLECDLLQGYLISKPISIEAFMAFANQDISR